VRNLADGEIVDPNVVAALGYKRLGASLIRISHDLGKIGDELVCCAEDLLEIAAVRKQAGRILVEGQLVDPTSGEVHAVIQMVASGFNVSPESIISGSRQRQTALARHVVMYLLKVTSNMSYPAIAKYFYTEDRGVTKSFDHSSVMHGVKRMRELLDKDSSLNVKVDAIRWQIVAPPHQAGH
jgi:hypothetical protein